VEGNLSDGSERNIDVQILAILDADPHVEEVRECEVLCRSCHEWVVLSPTQSDMLAEWKVHNDHCRSVQHSDPVTSSERQKYLLNDPQACIVNPRVIKCLVCQSEIILADTGDYDLTNWNTHKVQCRLVPAAKFTQGAGYTQSPKNVLIRETSPFGSSASEATMVSNSSVPRAGHKRVREDEVTDERPRTRARLETAGSPKRRGWKVLQPIKAFVHGFYEGLITTSST